MSVPTETRTGRHIVPRHTCSDLYGTTATDTQTHPSSAPTSAQAQKPTGTITPVQHDRHGQEQTRSTQKHKDFDSHRQKEVNKRHTNAHLEASSVPQRKKDFPIRIFKLFTLAPWTSPSSPIHRSHGIFPFRHLARPQVVALTTANSSLLTCQYFGALLGNLQGLRPNFTLGISFGAGVYVYVLGDRKRRLYALILNSRECGIVPSLSVKMRIC